MLIHSFRIEDWIPMSGNNRKWDLHGFFLAETGEEILLLDGLFPLHLLPQLYVPPRGFEPLSSG